MVGEGAIRGRMAARQAHFATGKPQYLVPEIHLRPTRHIP